MPSKHRSRQSHGDLFTLSHAGLRSCANLTRYGSLKIRALCGSDTQSEPGRLFTCQNDRMATGVYSCYSAWRIIIAIHYRSTSLRPFRIFTHQIYTFLTAISPVCKSHFINIVNIIHLHLYVEGIIKQLQHYSCHKQHPSLSHHKLRDARHAHQHPSQQNHLSHHHVHSATTSPERT